MAVRHTPNLCSRFQTAADLIGKRWTALVIQRLQDRPQRYSELAEALNQVSERMLIERLKELEGAGVVERRVIDDRPVRVEYRLTEKGRALSRVVSGLARWAEQWIPSTVGEPSH
jgi:DNA-binding HxlR family transcriptional regulator